MLTIGSRVALALGQVGSQDGVVEGIEVSGHAVVALVVVEDLVEERGTVGGGKRAGPRDVLGGKDRTGWTVSHRAGALCSRLWGE